MDKLQKYRKIRKWLEYASSMIATIIGISIHLGLYDKKLISLYTALSIAIIASLSLVLGNISIKIADKWYAKNMNK